MSNQPELALQQKCFKWFHNKFPEHRGKMWRVENERVRTKYEAMIAKSTGLVSGVSDMLFFHGGEFHAIEFKTAKGVLSDSQKRWRRVIELEGGFYHVVRSEAEFQEIVLEVLSK